jgi:hypothetical protein
LSFLVHQVGGPASIQFAGLMRDIASSYTWSFTMAGLLLLPAALSALSIREQTYAAKMQPRPASTIAFDRSPEDEVIDTQVSSL